MPQGTNNVCLQVWVYGLDNPNPHLPVLKFIWYKKDNYKQVFSKLAHIYACKPKEVLVLSFDGKWYSKGTQDNDLFLETTVFSFVLNGALIGDDSRLKLKKVLIGRYLVGVYYDRLGDFFETISQHIGIHIDKVVIRNPEGWIVAKGDARNNTPHSIKAPIFLLVST